MSPAKRVGRVSLEAAEGSGLTRELLASDAALLEDALEGSEGERELGGGYVGSR